MDELYDLRKKVSEQDQSLKKYKEIIKEHEEHIEKLKFSQQKLCEDLTNAGNEMLKLQKKNKKLKNKIEAERECFFEIIKLFISDGNKQLVISDPGKISAITKLL